MDEDTDLEHARGAVWENEPRMRKSWATPRVIESEIGQDTNKPYTIGEFSSPTSGSASS